MKLSKRQGDIARLLVIGHPTKQIAVALGISVNTCYEYIRDLYRKLGVENRAACTAKLVHFGFEAETADEHRSRTE